mmetsp:Transcript_31722/g.72808  ORF Transcript_31722/g.72808 Transcript_31722/m.72808 type:complete len:82 (+) Transcript_31722:233-478(+)
MTPPSSGALVSASPPLATATCAPPRVMIRQSIATAAAALSRVAAYRIPFHRAWCYSLAVHPPRHPRSLAGLAEGTGAADCR